MEITANWVHSAGLGYGRMGVRLAETLPKIGVDVVDGQDGKITNAVTWFSVPTHAHWWWKGQHRSILTMWESMRLAEGIVEGVDNFDVIMVPSQSNLELFSEVHPNVKLVLLGIDKDWRYVKRAEPEHYFNFLCAGSGPRKGTDLAVKAFQKVFPEGSWGDGPIPRLIMKNPRGEEFCHGERIELHAGKVSTQAEIDLYASAHCYLGPSRGEGFGLQPLQAIGQGCPTILTDAHGHASFAHLGYGLSTSAAPADYFSFGYAGDWWEPDFDELCERMRWVYDNWESARDFAIEASGVAHEQFTWENSARMLVDAIGADVLSAPYSGDGSRVDAELRRFRTILRVPWTADIAGRRHVFEPGVEYWETSDVLRILFDADALDPICLEDNKGLTAAQVERIGAYSAAETYCQTCHQQLGSASTKADDLMRDRELNRLRALVGEKEQALR